MGQRRSGRRGKGTCEAFIMIDKRLLEARAWLDLPLSAMVVYLYLKKQKINSDCNEHIKLPCYSTEHPISNHTFVRAIKKLVSHGFVELEEKGGLMKRANIYRLSDKWETWKRDTPYPYI